MKKSALIAFAAILSFSAIAAHASTIKGTSITGTISVNGSPGGGFSSNTFGTTTVGRGTEFDATTNTFQVDNGKAGARKKTFNIADVFGVNVNQNTNVVSVNYNCTSSPTGGCAFNPWAGFTVTLTDVFFYDKYPTVVSASSTGYSFTLSGDVLTITYAGGSNPSAFKLAMTPEPGSVVLFGSGLLGLMLMARRRLTA